MNREQAMPIDAPLVESDQLAVYRDIFAEITAKATPLEFAPDDPERITAYRVPCGPIHRAAGKLGFQMFDGERYLAMSMERNAELNAAFAEYVKNMDEVVIPQIEADIREREIRAAQLRFQPLGTTAAPLVEPDGLPAKAPEYETDDLPLKSWKGGWNAMHDEAAARLAAVERERDAAYSKGYHQAVFDKLPDLAASEAKVLALTTTLNVSRRRFELLGSRLGYDVEVNGVKASAAIADIDAALQTEGRADDKA